MNYLIGGPARNGKSWLSKRVAEYTGTTPISGDVERDRLKSTLIVTPETHPDIFEQVIDPINTFSPADAWLKRLRRRDKALWPFFEEELLRRNKLNPDQAQILEGNIWPDYARETQRNRKMAERAVYLIDTTSPRKQARRLLEIARGDGDNNWMATYPKEKLAKWAENNHTRSFLYRELCRSTRAVFFDVADGGIERASDQAFEYLVTGEV